MDELASLSLERGERYGLADVLSVRVVVLGVGGVPLPVWYLELGYPDAAVRRYYDGRGAPLGQPHALPPHHAACFGDLGAHVRARARLDHWAALMERSGLEIIGLARVSAWLDHANPPPGSAGPAGPGFAGRLLAAAHGVEAAAQVHLHTRRRATEDMLALLERTYGMFLRFRQDLHAWQEGAPPDVREVAAALHEVRAALGRADDAPTGDAPQVIELRQRLQEVRARAVDATPAEPELAGVILALLQDTLADLRHVGALELRALDQTEAMFASVLQALVSRMVADLLQEGPVG